MSEELNNPVEVTVTTTETQVVTTTEEKKETPEDLRRKEIQERLAAIKREADKAKAEAVSKLQPKVETQILENQVIETKTEIITVEEKTVEQPITLETQTTTVVTEMSKDMTPETKTETKQEPKKDVKTNVNKAKTVKTTIMTETTETKKRRTNKLFLFGGIAAIIIIAIVVYFLLMPSHWKAIISVFSKKTAETTIVENNTSTESNSSSTTSTSTSSSTANNVADNSKKNNTTTAQSAEDAKKANATTDASKATDAKNQTEIQKNKPEPIKKATTETNKIDKGVLQPPCFVISYFVTKDEQKAITMVADLKKLGFSGAGYFWMSDYQPSKGKDYKVYAGVYQTRADARKAIDAVRKVKADAFIDKIKAKK